MKYAVMGYYRPADEDDTAEILGVFDDIDAAVKAVNETYPDLKWFDNYRDDNLPVRCGMIKGNGGWGNQNYIIEIFYAPYNTLSWADEIEHAVSNSK